MMDSEVKGMKKERDFEVPTKGLGSDINESGPWKVSTNMVRTELIWSSSELQQP
jgi:hypothetical protein